MGGTNVGAVVGASVGGTTVGALVGATVGGSAVGAIVGTAVGATVGVAGDGVFPDAQAVNSTARIRTIDTSFFFMFLLEFTMLD